MTGIGVPAADLNETGIGVFVADRKEEGTGLLLNPPILFADDIPADGGGIWDEAMEL